MFFGFTNSTFPNALPSEARVCFWSVKGAAWFKENVGSGRGYPKCQEKIVVLTVG